MRCFADSPVAAGKPPIGNAWPPDVNQLFASANPPQTACRNDARS
jgi:hypothetical protein